MTTALPFLNKTPARAGKRAKASDKDASDEESPGEEKVSALPGSLDWGFSMSRASLRLYSEKLELLRGGIVSMAGNDEVGALRAAAASSAAETVMARRSPWPEGGAALTAELTPVPGLHPLVDVVFSSVMAAEVFGRRYAAGVGGPATTVPYKFEKRCRGWRGEARVGVGRERRRGHATWKK